MTSSVMADGPSINLVIYDCYLGFYMSVGLRHASL